MDKPSAEAPKGYDDSGPKPCPYCRHLEWKNLGGLTATTVVFDNPAAKRIEAYVFRCERCGFLRWHDKNYVTYGA